MPLDMETQAQRAQRSVATAMLLDAIDACGKLTEEAFVEALTVGIAKRCSSATLAHAVGQKVESRLYMRARNA